MGIVCKIRGHRWHKTPDGKDGCCCERCGERNYDGYHDLHKQPGSCVERCTWCGSTYTRHDWNHCTCAWCGEVRDFDHKWQQVSGTCDFKCAVCGKVSDDKKNHKWAGCTCARCGVVRNEGHDFVLAPDGSGALVCSICGINIDESRANAAIEALRKWHGNSWKCSEAERLVEQITDPAFLMPIMSYCSYFALRRMAELRADEELASIARNEKYGYETRRDARDKIRNQELRESITVERSEWELQQAAEDYWYQYDIKSGM